jgi:hypothetical protein
VACSSKIGAVGAGLVLLATAPCCGSGGAGPLGEPKDAGVTRTGMPVKTHQFALTALPLLPGRIDHPLELLGVRLLHPEDAHGLVIRYAVEIPRVAILAGGRGWRAKARGLKPLPGYVVQPHTTTEIVVGAAAAKPGIYLLRGFIIDYRIGGTHYHAMRHQQLEVCAGKRDCSAPDPYPLVP